MDVISYQDFDLQIQWIGDEYRAQVLNSPRGQASTTFTHPFSEMELKYYLMRFAPMRRGMRGIDSQEVSEAKEFGGALFSSVFKEGVRDCLLGSLGIAKQQGMGLRIRLRLTDVPELVDLPWEYLFDPNDDFLTLSNKTPLIRYLEFAEYVQPLEVKPPLRILVMISSPIDYPELDVNREWSNLRKAVTTLEKHGLVTLERVGGTFEALQRRLLNSNYHIFHYIGHGGFDPKSQGGVLLFENEDRRSRYVSGEDLGRMLRDHSSMRLAVLNACEGARADKTDPFAGTAQSLIRKNLPAVIAMQFEISDGAAITFAQWFYGAVAVGYPVDAALAEARKAIFAQGNGLEWGTPVLYLRAPDGRIFNVEQTAEVRKRIRVAELADDADSAVAREDWWSAVEALRSLLILDSTNNEAIAKLAEIQNQEELARLYTEANRLVENEDWIDAKPRLQRLLEQAGKYKDTETLLARVETELHKLKREKTSEAESLPPTLPEIITEQNQSPILQDDVSIGSEDSNQQRVEAARVIETDTRQTLPSEISSKEIAPSRNRSAAILTGAIGAIVGIIAVSMFVIWLIGKNGIQPISNQNNSAGQRPVATLTIPAVVPAGMAYAEGGEFTMGRNDGEEYEYPAHQERVDPFFVDLYEVTCEEYQKFVEATHHRSPPKWSGDKYPNDAQKKPVTGVTLSDAKAYADWRSQRDGGTYRIPTEEQWEFAARGKDGRRYPWGNDWNAELANVSGSLSTRDAFKGKSPVGAFDMVGNVWEWTTSVLKPHPGASVKKKYKNLFVIRGGAYDSNYQTSATTSYRGGLPAEDPGQYGPKLGFRCVKSIGP